MTRFATLILLLMPSMLVPAGLRAQGLPAPPELSVLPEPVREFMQAKGLPLESISIYVQGVNDPVPVFSYNADVPRNPASVMKVVTTMAGLEMLGPNFQWRTDVLAATPLEDGRLAGPLYLRGRGDPMLTTSNLWRGLRSLRDFGVRDVAGGLVVDQSAFRVDDVDPGAFDRQRYRAYNALPAAMLVNYNATTFYFHPDPKQNRVHVITDPPSTTLQLENKLTLVSGKCRGQHRKIAMDVLVGAPRPRVAFSGNYPTSCGSHMLLRSIDPDEHYILGIVDVLWREMGGSIENSVSIGRAPKGARLLAQIQSDPLAEVIRGMNKYSNNVMTRQLFLTIGREIEGSPGTKEKSRTAIARWIREKGIDPNGFFADNGSGLSRVASTTARQLGGLLTSIYHSPMLGEFIGSLPLSAIDGTMRKRFRKTALAGRVRMKTGLIRDVRAGAGYLWTASNKVYVVVMLHNHPGVHLSLGTQVQDRLLKWLFANKP